MPVFEDEWVEVNNPISPEDIVYLNLNAELKSEEPLVVNTESLTPERIEGVNDNGWDVVKSRLSAPEAAGVRRVGMNFEHGLIGVYDGDGYTSYVLGAVGEEGAFAVIDSRGNVSDRATSVMSAKHGAAVVETLHEEAEIEEEGVIEKDVGLKSSTQMYEDVMNEGNYDVLSKGIVFRGFDSVEGHSSIKSDERKASAFLDMLDDIAAFYRDFEQDYNSNNDFTDCDIPITPMRDAGGYHKFRVPGTNNDASIVLDSDYDREDVIEVDVIAFSGHKGRANRC